MRAVQAAGVVLLLAACAERVAFVRVQDAETGAALAGARVTTAQSDVIAVTDSAGTCPYPGGASGRTAVSAARAGYFPAALKAAEGRQAGPGGRFLVVGLYSRLPRVVSCLVADSLTGAPRSAAGVSILPAGIEAEPDADGCWWFDSFPAGPVLVQARAEGCAARTLTVRARGGETTTVRFALLDTLDCGRVEVEVLDSLTGLPVPECTVRIEGGALSAASGPDGRAVLEAVPAGEHVLAVQADGYAGRRVRFPLVRGWTVIVRASLNRQR